MVEPLTINFRVFTERLVGVQKFRNFTIYMCINEPRYEKTGFLHMGKQRCRSASR